MRLRVTEVRDGGNSPIPSGGFVLSAGPALVRRLPTVSPRQVLEVDLATSAPVEQAVSGIGGGPMLVRNHRPVRIEIPDDDAYQFKSMRERHPRSAVGWDRDHYFLVTVDGRQKGSVGMTLDELGKHLAAIGCSEAMNLDGGGSATLWADGRIRNRPSDGVERPIANALVAVRIDPKSP
jgi:exopolysaccharide biosynthesis protein